MQQCRNRPNTNNLTTERPDSFEDEREDLRSGRVPEGYQKVKHRDRRKRAMRGYPAASGRKLANHHITGPSSGKKGGLDRKKNQGSGKASEGGERHKYERHSEKDFRRKRRP